MATEGHSWDCDCECCAGEESQTAATSPHACVCPVCGKSVPNEVGLACSEVKCPQCGAAMKPGQ
jgi:hypothetical protein